MYSRLKLVSKYLCYFFTASNGKGHGVHSPFAFEFITKVLNDKTIYPAYNEIEGLREQLLKNFTVLKVDDFGAGSSVSKTNERTVASIASTAVKPKKYAQLLYRMVNFYKPAAILELGTSLGITTAYLAKANQAGKVITMEGAKAILSIARQNFESLRIDNVKTVEGNFDETLPKVIDELLPSIDFAFIDGNHRRDPTIQYFNTIMAKTNNLSIIILDDIHWSGEMEEAWKYCKEHASITLSIDLFFIGILISRKEIREKQHFIIRF